jgi:hypothetical protein
MRRHVPLPRILLAVVTLGASAAWAQQAPAGSPPARPCAADVARLCPEAQGRQAVHACLKQNAEQVSAECKARIDQVRQRFEAAREACKDDVATYCSSVQPGGHRIAACLRQHTSELSQSCQVAISAPRARGS